MSQYCIQTLFPAYQTHRPSNLADSENVDRPLQPKNSRKMPQASAFRPPASHYPSGFTPGQPAPRHQDIPRPRRRVVNSVPRLIRTSLSGMILIVRVSGEDTIIALREGRVVVIIRGVIPTPERGWPRSTVLVDGLIDDLAGDDDEPGEKVSPLEKGSPLPEAGCVVAAREGGLGAGPGGLCGLVGLVIPLVSCPRDDGGSRGELGEVHSVVDDGGGKGRGRDGHEREQRNGSHLV